MQKILICENYGLELMNTPFTNLLVDLYGNDRTYWNLYLLEHTGIKSLRTDPKIHEAIIQRNFNLGKIYEYDEEPEYMICKIIEVQDDVEWDVYGEECGTGEYVCEKHRVWS